MVPYQMSQGKKKKVIFFLLSEYSVVARVLIPPMKAIAATFTGHISVSHFSSKQCTVEVTQTVLWAALLDGLNRILLLLDLHSEWQGRRESMLASSFPNGSVVLRHI